MLIWLGGDAEILADAVRAAPDLRWIQLPSAGIERYSAAVDTEHVWACAKGAFGPVVGELGVAMILAASRHIHQFARAKSWERWEGKTLRGTTALFVGGGGIAQSMITMLEPFGVRSYVVRRHAREVPGADIVAGNERLNELIPEADWVVVAVPLTDETEGMFDAKRLSLMKKDAWIINLARGKHIVTDDLVEAIRTGTIAGAALDVTDPEPLPDGHALWDMENVIITPHAGGAGPQSWMPHLAERVLDNLKRDQEGKPLAGLIDPALGY